MSLFSYLKGIVVTIRLDLSLTVPISLSISATCYLYVEVFKMIFAISSYMVFLKYMFMSTVYTIMPLLKYIFITRFLDLINGLAVLVGMFLPVTNFILCDMVIMKVTPFTNITSATRVTNLCSLKKKDWYSYVIHHHPIRILLHCLSPGTSKVFTRHGVRIIDIRGSNSEVFIVFFLTTDLNYISY